MNITKSARGNASEGRYDRDTQAVYSLRGVPLNSFNTKIDVVRKNTELDVLIDILGCGIGPGFNIKKLNYNKIIIMADSDSDGFNITSLMCAFFIYHMPELVKQGYIYKAVSPLYELKHKKRFVLNKQGYAEVFEKEIHNNVIVTDINKNKLKERELQKILIDGKDYVEELDRASRRLAVDPHIIEFYLIHRNDKGFEKKFKKEFPELVIENDVLSGIYQGRYQIMFLDKLFEKRVSTLNDFINKVYKGKMYYYVQEKSGKSLNDMGLMSIGEFMRMVDKFQPIIKTRFKGVGELDASELKETSMDPNNRILIRLTSEDIEKELAVFNTLHGDSSESRRKMMQHFKIKRDDLDN